MAVGLTVSLMQTETEGFAQIRTIAVKLIALTDTLLSDFIGFNPGGSGIYLLLH